jgi:hypothetical protein
MCVVYFVHCIGFKVQSGSKLLVYFMNKIVVYMKSKIMNTAVNCFCILFIVFVSASLHQPQCPVCVCVCARARARSLSVDNSRKTIKE